MDAYRCPIRPSSTLEVLISLGLIVPLVTFGVGSFVPYALFINPQTTVGVFVCWSTVGLMGGLLGGGLLARRLHRKLAGRDGEVRLEPTQLVLALKGKEPLIFSRDEPIRIDSGWYDIASGVHTGSSTVRTRARGIHSLLRQGDKEALLCAEDGFDRAPEMGIAKREASRPLPDTTVRLYARDLCSLLEQLAQRRDTPAQ